MSAPEPIASRQESWQLLAWALVLLTACFALYTQHNNFPFYYHPDEPGKVEQLLTGNWNFHHPMLLLATTEVVVRTGHVALAEQPVVEAGRWVSAGFMGVAVVAFSLLAYAWRGWAAAFAAGGALLLHHQFFELAHYLKEDSALLAGLALTFLMLFACWWQPTPVRTTLLGSAVGLAVSGKYLGVVAIALALPVLWHAAAADRGRRFAIFAGALVATFAIVNLPLLLHLATFRESFGREMEFVVNGQRGLTRSVPHAQYWNVFVDNTTPVIWLLLGFFLYARWRERRKLILPEWMLILFPFAYALALSFSPKTNDRYFLPATALFTLFAAIGVLDAARLLAERSVRPRWVLGFMALLFAAQYGSPPSPLDWHSLAEYRASFQRDDTAELIHWLNTEVPPDAVIAKDNRVQLPDPKKKKHAARVGLVPQPVIAARFVADLGTLPELRAQGINYVAVSESDYGRFFLNGLRPQKDERVDFDRRKAFYEKLLREGEPVFTRDRGTVIYLHPGIRVYRLGREGG